MNKYISLKKAALKYDFHIDTLKNHLKNMQEGIHYFKMLGQVRFDEEKLHNYLTQKESDYAIDISKFLR